MKDAISAHWKLRLEALKTTLEDNNFTCEVVDDIGAARDLILEEIVPVLAPRTVSFGGSLTLTDSGVYQGIKDQKRYDILDTFDKDMPLEKKLELRRKALLADLFLTGTNAVTEDGMLVNLDMYGNRTAAQQFGPRNVIILAGRNKVVPGLAEAMERIKEYAAPVNALRLKKKTPCVKTGRCHDCSSEERICNVWSVIEKSYPRGRIVVVLINQDLGF